MLSNRNFYLIMLVYFGLIALALFAFGCSESDWTTSPKAYQTPSKSVVSVETATVGVITYHEVEK